MLPKLRLVFLLAKLAKDHGTKILHGGNTGLLTEDLGNALAEQKRVLSDPDKGTIMTAYDVLPLIVEVKVLTFTVAKQLGVSTKDKPDIEILEAIIAEAKTRGIESRAEKIEETLEWTRALFSHPEIQEVLKMDMTPIQKPRSLGDIGKLFKQVAFRSKDELDRIQDFLLKAKEVEENKRKPPATGI